MEKKHNRKKEEKIVHWLHPFADWGIPVGVREAPAKSIAAPTTKITTFPTTTSPAMTMRIAPRSCSREEEMMRLIMIQDRDGI